MPGKKTSPDGSPLKSAWELAAERMAGGTAGLVQLSDAQKEAIAAAHCRVKAKVAEIEILFADKIAAEQDIDKRQTIEDQRASEIRKQREAGDREVDRIRAGSG